MPKRKSIYPGSVYAQRGKLYIKYRVRDEFDIKGKPLFRRVALGIDDTPTGRKLADEKKRHLYMTGLLPESETAVKKKRVTLQEAWKLFEQSKSLMQKTLVNYRLAFDVITRRQNYIMTVELIEMDIVRFRNTTAKNNGYSQITINSYLTQFQVFLNFCTSKGFIPQTQFKSQYRTKAPKPPVLIYTNEEIQLMLLDLQEYEPEFACLIELMIETGARPVDALNLKFSQCLEKSIVWHNKINKTDEETPISSKAREILKKLREIGNGRNEVFRWNHSSLPFLTKKLNECMERCGIEKKGRSFKHFRTTFKYSIRHLPFELQMKLMRHSKPDITLGHYTFYNKDEITDKLDGQKQ